MSGDHREADAVKKTLKAPTLRCRCSWMCHRNTWLFHSFKSKQNSKRSSWQKKSRAIPSLKKGSKYELKGHAGSKLSKCATTNPKSRSASLPSKLCTVQRCIIQHVHGLSTWWDTDDTVTPRVMDTLLRKRRQHSEHTVITLTSSCP